MEKKIKLIDVDALRKEFNTKCRCECYYCDYYTFNKLEGVPECGLINQAPIIREVTEE